MFVPIILIMIIVAIVIHEGSHVLAATFFGGRWVGIRIRGYSIAVVIDTARLTVQDRRMVALAGLIVDGLGFMGSFLWLANYPSQLALAAMIWWGTSVVINSCPYIPRSDGWRLYHNNFVPTPNSQF